MTNVNVSKPIAGGASGFNFESAKALAFSLAKSAPELIEPGLIAWFDRASSMVSPALEGCSWPYGWHDYGISHGGRLEVDVGGEDTFIFAESSPFDSYEHFGLGPFVNIRDDHGEEMISRVDGWDCVHLDEWTGKLT